MEVAYKVSWSEKVDKTLRKIPRYIRDKFHLWVFLVESQGLEEVRRRLGFHDEPLVGQRRGQRSIRLSRAYRAIYELTEGGRLRIIEVKEISKHEY